MTLQVTIPDLLAQQAADLATRQHVSVDEIIATALSDKILADTRPTVAERARRVDWTRVDEILRRVPANPPLPGD